MIKVLAISMCSLLIAGSIAIVDRGSVDFEDARPAAATAADPSQVYASGIVEGRTEDVELVPESSGRVGQVLVHVGDWVDEGQILIRLDDRTQRAQVAVSRAKLQLAQANLDRLVNGARIAERQEAHALLTAKQARLKQALLTWQRVQRLRAQEAIAQQEADDHEGVFNTLSAEVEACQARVNQLEAPAREDELRAAQARIAAAQADYEMSQIALDRSALRAPMRAQVLDVLVEPGEMILPERSEPVIVLADTSKLRVRAFVEEIDAPRVDVGVGAQVTADGLPNRTFQAIVAVVSPGMKAKKVATDRPNELYDSKMREVVCDLTDPGAGCQLLTGLRVDVLFDVEPRAESMASPDSTPADRNL